MDFFDEGNYYTVTRCLLLDDISMGKVTKALTYSFNVFDMFHSFLEGGTEKISDWITGAKYFKWALFIWISNA